MTNLQNPVTPEELHLKAAKLKHSKWTTQECPECDAKLGYIFDGDKVYINAGCRCENSIGQTLPSSWKSVAAEVNTLLQTSEAAEVIKFWQL